MSRLFAKSLRLVYGLSIVLTLVASCSDKFEVQISTQKQKKKEYKDPSQYIAVFGDIQYYTNSVDDYLFRTSLEWIKKATDTIDIIGVLHTGDITQSDDILTEWPYFDAAIRGISDIIPFISAIGDHDYSWSKTLIVDRNDTHFSSHVRFPIVTKRIEASFERNRMENIVVRNEIHGERVDFLVLEFGPREEVVEWANEWVSSHPDVKYILINHEYLEQGGGRRVKGLKCVSRMRNTTYTTPDELWERLIKCNDNILCVLCGHVGGLYAVTVEKNDFGREVCQIEHNIQGPIFRYDNWLMIWKFPKEEDEAIVSIINTKSGEKYNNQDTLFTFKYRY